MVSTRKTPLTGSVDDVIASFGNKKQQALAQKKAAKEAARLERLAQLDKATPFRLLDLPAEIRNKIYKYAVCDEDVYRKPGDICSPTLALVSKQMHMEVVPVFLAGNLFRITIKSNYDDASRLDTIGPITAKTKVSAEVRDLKARAKMSGKLQLTPTAKRLLSSLRSSAVFQNIIIRVEQALVGKRRPSLFHFHIRTSKTSAGSLLVEKLHVKRNPKFDAFEQAIEAIMEEVKDRAGIKGLTVQDLSIVAKALRYWPVE